MYQAKLSFLQHLKLLHTAGACLRNDMEKETGIYRIFV